MNRTKRIGLMFWVCLFSTVAAQAGPFVPWSVKPGDQYYLAFTTADERDATSTAIADYNDFVQTEAALATAKTGTNANKTGTKWSALASTAAKSAKDNLGLADKPVFLLAGTKIVSNGTDLWSGANLLNPIDKDQSAAATPDFRQTWTGTTTAGAIDSNPLGNTPVRVGTPKDVGSTWINASLVSQSSTESLYAVSEVLTAPARTGPVVPPGLHVGDKYYLTFLTSGDRDAKSANIADYNDFVQAQAALAPYNTGTNADKSGVQWKAIASTSAKSAADNLGLTDAPVYLLDGVTRVADKGTLLWNPNLLHAINETQSAEIRSGNTLRVWTGTNVDGSIAEADNEGFGGPLGAFGPTIGDPSMTNGFWVNESSGSNEGTRPLYAVSQLFTVGQPLPEPSTWVLALVGAIGMSTARKRTHASC